MSVAGQQMAYEESTGGLGKLRRDELRQSKNSSLVPCFPLHSLLVALNQSTVDYLSLDVEGFELEVKPTLLLIMRFCCFCNIECFLN